MNQRARRPFAELIPIVAVWALASPALSQPAPAPAAAKHTPGISYVVLKAGPTTGLTPTRNSAVRVRYEGRVDKGAVFDTSPEEGRIVPLKAMIPGFQAALLMMRPGDEWEVRIPSELAYGARGPQPVGGATLVFKIALLESAEMGPTPPPFLNAMPKPLEPKQ